MLMEQNQLNLILSQSFLDNIQVAKRMTTENCASRSFTNLSDAGSNQMDGPNIISEFDLDQDYEGQDIEYEKLKIIPVCKKALAELLAR
jgi:hypothetical protein